MNKIGIKTVFCYIVFFSLCIQPTYSFSEIQTNSWKMNICIALGSLITGATLHSLYTHYWGKKVVQLSSDTSKHLVEKVDQSSQTSETQEDRAIFLENLLKQTCSTHGVPDGKSEKSKKRNSGIIFAGDVVTSIIGFANGGSISALALDPKHLRRFNDDKQIQCYFEQLCKNREGYLDEQGKILGECATHVKQNYLRQPVPRRPRQNVLAMFDPRGLK